MRNLLAFLKNYLFSPVASILLIMHIAMIFAVQQKSKFSFDLASWSKALFLALFLAAFVSVLYSAQRRRFLARSLAVLILIFVVLSWTYNLLHLRFASPEDVYLLNYLFEAYTLEVALKIDTLIMLGFVFVLVVIFSFLIQRRTSRYKVSWRPVICNLMVFFFFVLFFPDHHQLKRTTPEAALFAYAMEPRKLPDSSWYDIHELESQVESISTANYDVSYQANDLNVVIILVESLRRDLIGLRTPDGNLVMPYLTALAEEGLAYPQAYAQSSDTTMSTYSILSGLYPLHYAGRPPHAPPFNLLLFLKERGWQTGLFTNFEWAWVEKLLELVDFGSDPTKSINSFVSGKKSSQQNSSAERSTVVYDRKILSQLDEINIHKFKEWFHKDDQRKAVLMALYGTHFPYNADSATTVNTFSYGPSEKDVMWQAFLESCTKADSYLKDLISSIESAPKPTIIAILGDHGEEFYEHGGCLHAATLPREVLNVGLILKGQNSNCLKPEKVTQAVGQIDLVPTILNQLNVKTPFSFQGKDLCQAIENRPIFASSRAVRNQDVAIFNGFKYLLDLDGYPAEVYDLETDPLETNNIVSQIGLNDRLNCLIKEYQAAQIAYTASSNLQQIPAPQFDSKFLEYVQFCVEKSE